MAAYSEITIEQYSDFSTSISLEDINGNEMNLQNYSAYSQIRKSPYSESYYSFSTNIPNASNGTIFITMTAANTANIQPGRYLYDAVIIGPNSETTRVVEGIATVTPGVTRL